MRRTVRRFAIAFAALPLVAGAALATSYAAAAERPTDATAAVTLTAMTWNIHGEGADIPAIANLVKTHDVDVLTVQEIHRRPGNDQVKQLADALGWELGTNVHFGPADHPGPCDDEWEGEAGNAVFTAFPIVERVTKPLSPADQDCPVKRSLAGVKLDLGGGGYLRVFTSHFTPGHSDAAVRLRQQQADTVRDYLTHSGPLLFTGDLNDTPGSTVHRWFAAAFTDCGGALAPDPTHGTARIDYIFARAVTPTDGYVVDTNLSDHRPLVITMQVS